jgi:acetylornithine deacetylase/succinyl-diaminopimelate desuccinylase-like protein
MATLTELDKHFEDNRSKILQDFFTFLKFESISADDEYKKQSLACADWVQKQFKDLGFHVEVWPTAGNPTIYASYDKAGKDKPTILIYHHYDVQPVDPLELWENPPFEPILKGDNVFARGAQDNKGQCFTTLLTLKTLMAKEGKFPINIKVIVEGEEEISSPGLAKLLKEKKDVLKADYVAIIDSGIRDAKSPAVTLGARGIITMDINVKSAKGDLHSGSHGGIVVNPIHALVEILAKLRDPSTGEVLIPGFYDDVAELSAEDKKLFTFDFDHKDYEKEYGTPALGGEKMYSPYERAWVRPTLEVNGISGGYAGKGFKTVLPALANAKVSCRLVPNQSPEKIRKLVKSYIEKIAPKGVKVSVDMHEGGGPGIRTSPNSKIVQAFAKAYSEVFKKPTEFILEGGSIPITSDLTAASQGAMSFVGLGLPSDQIHAPNEHFSVTRIKQGYMSLAKALELLGQ